MNIHSKQLVLKIEKYNNWLILTGGTDVFMVSKSHQYDGLLLVESRDTVVTPLMMTACDVLSYIQDMTCGYIVNWCEVYGAVSALVGSEVR